MMMGYVCAALIASYIFVYNRQSVGARVASAALWTQYDSVCVCVCAHVVYGALARTPEAEIQSLEVEAQNAPEIADDFDVGVDEPVGHVLHPFFQSVFFSVLVLGERDYYHEGGLIAQ
eukprot:7803887-Pyramimonas_sp.AAC.1